MIPARYASTRFDGKPLADIHGKPMVQWVYEQAKRARGVAEIIVATDDARIMAAVHRFGGRAIMTDPGLPSGTDRVAAVADQVPGDIYVNLQGDDPAVDPRAIDRAVECVASGRFGMATVMSPIRDRSELLNPAVVKVVADKTGRAIYFSRHAIPYSRTSGPRLEGGEPFACRRHVGLYVYARETLLRFRDLPPSALERGEMLEQLRALEEGIPIGIEEIDFVSIGVDTPEDLEKARKHLAGSL